MPGYKGRHDPQGVDSLINPRGEGGLPFSQCEGLMELVFPLGLVASSSARRGQA